MLTIRGAIMRLMAGFLVGALGVTTAIAQETVPTRTQDPTSKYTLLKFGKIKYKPGYSAFKLYQYNDNPMTGYIELNGVKVANYTAARSTPHNQVAIARLAKSSYVLNVDEGELVTGVKKSVDSWIKDIKAKGKRLIGNAINEDTISQEGSSKKSSTKKAIPAKQVELKVESQSLGMGPGNTVPHTNS